MASAFAHACWPLVLLWPFLGCLCFLSVWPILGGLRFLSCAARALYTVWVWPLAASITRSCLLPPCHLSSPFAGCVLRWAGASQAAGLALVCFRFCRLHFWCRTCDIIAEMNVKKLFSCIFFWESYSFRPFMLKSSIRLRWFLHTMQCKPPMTSFCMWHSGFQHHLLERSEESREHRQTSGTGESPEINPGAQLTAFTYRLE